MLGDCLGKQTCLVVCKITTVDAEHHLAKSCDGRNHLSCQLLLDSILLRRSAMLVNHFKMRSDVLSYNLGGMGCSAGVIAIGLADKLLQVTRQRPLSALAVV